MVIFRRPLTQPELLMRVDIEKRSIIAFRRVFLALFSHEAVIFRIKGKLKKILHSLESLESGVNFLDDLRMIEEIDELRERIQTIRTKMDDSIGIYRSTADEQLDFFKSFCTLLQTEEVTNEQIKENLMQMEKTRSKFVDSLDKFYLLGYEIGRLLNDFDDADFIFNFFRKYRGGGLPEEELEEFRQIIGLTAEHTKKRLIDEEEAVDDEVNWQETLMDLVVYIDELKEEAELAQNSLQEFDNVRQIIERRLGEIQLMTDLLKDKDPLVDDIHDQILPSMYGRLMLSPEKSIFRLFFSQYEAELEKKSKTQANQGGCTSFLTRFLIFMFS